MAQNRTGRPPKDKEAGSHPETDAKGTAETAEESPHPETEDLAPGEFRLRLVRDAVLGNGQRKRGQTLGSCHVHPGYTEAEVFDAVKDPRWIEQLPHDGGPGVVLRMARDRGNRRKGDDLCYIRPTELDANGDRADYTVRECVNALRNPKYLGR